jgi:RNA polymerase sigma-70 factor (ECF subfamily)
VSVGGAATTDSLPVDATLTTADFAECYQLHYARLIRSLCLAGADHPQAEDVAQEAFARTLVNWRRVRRGANPPGYVYRTAFRLYARRLPREQLSSDGDPPSASFSGADLQAEAVTRLSVEAVLAQMPPRRRLCATLCFMVGLTTGETAAALGITEGTVRKQLEAARVSLRRAL